MLYGTLIQTYVLTYVGIPVYILCACATCMCYDGTVEACIVCTSSLDPTL